MKFISEGKALVVLNMNFGISEVPFFATDLRKMVHSFTSY